MIAEMRDREIGEIYDLNFYKALSKMSPNQRESFVDHFIVGLTYQSIADKRKVSRSAIESHIRGAVVIFTRCYMRRLNATVIQT